MTLALATTLHRRVPPGTFLLALGQALNLTVAVLMVTVAGAAGDQLAPDAAWATLPYGVQFAAVLVCTYPASALMRRTGRRSVLAGAAAILILAGAVGLLSLERDHFAGLVFAHALVGVYVACANFFRFAAVDGLAERERSRVLSLVVAGGVLAALAGPPLASVLRQVAGFADFAWVYGSLMALGVAQLALMAAWRPGTRGGAAAPIQTDRPTGPAAAASGLAPDARPSVALVIATAAGAYLVMNLLMVQSSLLLKDLCDFDRSSRAIQLHVLAMFAPSFITGHLIARLGLRIVLPAGLALMSAAAAAGMLLTPSYAAGVVELMLLGLGWNLSYVGGSALLALAVPEGSRHRWQGLHESAIAACATAGAFLPAPLLAHAGWAATNAIAFGACATGLVACHRVLAGQPLARRQHA